MASPELRRLWQLHQVDKAILEVEAHTLGAPALIRRSVQDDSQRACSMIGGTGGGANLSQEQSAAIVKAARDSIQYPASGKLSGDWKTGEQLVTDGRGQRIVNGQVEKLPFTLG